MSMAFSEHRPISWTRQVKVKVKVPRPVNASARGQEAPPRPLRRYSVCGIRWRTRLAVLRRGATKSDKGFCLSALPLAVIARTAECHHHNHHHYSEGASIASLILFCQSPSNFLSSFSAHAASLWISARNVFRLII